MGHPTVYPTGVTLYNPEKAYNGYTVMPVKEQGAMLIDMNGQEIKLWKGVHGFPNKIFPGGYEDYLKQREASRAPGAGCSSAVLP